MSQHPQETTLQREHLSDFVVTTVKENRGQVSLTWHVDAARRRLLERTRLGRRVMCSDHHNWSNGRIVHAFRGQWNNSLRLHTFATVIGLTLVSLVRLTLGNRKSAQSTLKALSEVKATRVRVRTKERGRRATVMLAAGHNRRTAQGDQDL